MNETETELAKHIANEEYKEHDAETKVRINSASESTYMSANNLIKINLSDPMKNFKIKYEYNKVIFGVFVITLLIMLLGNTAFFGLYLVTANKAVLQTVVIIVFSIVLGLCVCILFLGYYISGRSKEKLLVYLNTNLLNMKETDFDDPKQLFDIHEMEHFGFNFIISVMYCSICIILFEIFYHDILISYDICTGDIETSLDPSGCLIVFSTFSQTYPFVISLVLIFFFKTVTTQCKNEIAKHKKTLLDNYSESVKNIDDNICNKLSEWKENKQFKNRKKEAVIVFVFMFFFFLSVNGIFRNDLLGVAKTSDGFEWILCLVFYIGDAVFLSWLFVSFRTFHLHFKFPIIIMDQLLCPINGTTIDDIIGWWELRKFYGYCVVNIMVSSLEIQIFLYLSISAALTIEVYWVISWGANATFIIMITAVLIVLVILAFFSVSDAVGYHNFQLKHLNTINKEKLQIDRNELSEYMNMNELSDLKALMREINHNIIDDIIEDIKQNSLTISVLGVRMDSNFLFFLRGIVITFIIGFIIEIGL